MTRQTPTQRLRAFIASESAGGIVLIVAAAIALVIANSALLAGYQSLLATPVNFTAGELVSIDKPLLLWINDGLMALFFFLVGLEIKRELVVGELSKVKQAALPFIAAAGGMLIPALIYVVINWTDDIALNGWAIPAATDIAFAVGVLALLGSRVPPALKVFLLAVAIIDDLGAILIIAFFYTADLSAAALGLAAVGVAVLVMLNLRGVTRVAPYALVGLFIWICVLKSGVHATLAGVVTALAIPLVPAPGDQRSLLVKLEENLHPWVNYGVLPLFAFANAGVSLAGMSIDKLFGPIPMGIALGLFLGKPIGIFSFSYAAIRSGLAGRPEGSNWTQIVGVAWLGGIGFTMSLFIGMLAFVDAERATDIRIGVLLGSIASAIVGYMVLKWAATPIVREKAVAT